MTARPLHAATPRPPTGLSGLVQSCHDERATNDGLVGSASRISVRLPGTVDTQAVPPSSAMPQADPRGSESAPISVAADGSDVAGL